MVARQLDLDDVRAEQRRHVGAIGGDVERELALLRDVAAARIGPDDRGDADRLRLGRKLADLLDHLEIVVRAGIDGEADRRAAEAQRVVDPAGHRLVLARRPAVRAVDLEDGRDLAGEGVRARLEHAERRGIGVEPGVDRELVVIMGIVGGGLTAKLRPGPCSKPWSTGRMTILPVPPSRPCIRMRARLALVPGLSDSYLSRIALTAGVMLIAREAPLLPIRFGLAPRYRSRARRTNPGRRRRGAMMVKLLFTIPVYHASRGIGDLP